MKILMVSSYLPYPLFSGGHIRLYNILMRLSKNHEITLVCEKRDNQTEEDIEEVEKICKNVITITRKKQWSISNILKTGLSSKAFLLTGHFLPEMRKIITDLLGKENFDLIHIETFYVAQNLPETNLPTIVAEHNIEYSVYKRFTDKTSFVLKPFLLLDILKLKTAEEKIWKNSKAVAAVSKQEKEIIGKYNKNVHVVPNGVDLNKFKYEERKTNYEITILYIGDFKWIQNVDAVDFILRKVWPSLITENKNLKFLIVGKNIPQNLKNIRGESVVFDENASDNTIEIFKKADILFAPIRVGGGTSYKILEAMASGVPVITTDLGAGGIGAKDKENIIVANSEREMIGAVKNLLSDKELLNKIRKNARKLIEDKYNWDNIVVELEKVYKTLV